MGTEAETKVARAAALGGGVLLALAASLVGTAFRGERTSGLAPAGAAAWWAVDRDADAVYALDRDLILVGCTRIQSPLDVRSTADGGAWILLSSSGTSRGTRSLARIRPDGAIETAIQVGTVTSWTVDERGDALAIEDERRLLRCSEDGTARTLLEEPGLACVAGSGDSVLVGSRSGEIRRLSDRSGVDELECFRLDEPIVALAPSGPGAFLLLGEEGTRVALVDASLSLVWTTPCATRCTGLALTPDRAFVWVVDTGDARIRRFDRSGSRLLERSVPGLQGTGRAVATGEGGLLLVTPGAILALDENGKGEPGQGGFVYLSGVDRIPPREP